MIIKVEQDLTKKEIEVLIKHNDRNHEVERIVALIQLAEKQIQCNLQEKEVLVNVSDIYYIESVDKKTFVYCEKEVYRTELRLYQLLEILSKSSFIQVSKSCILNLNMLESFRPLLNSRLEALLKNGERIYVTRKYLSMVKQELQKEVLA
ncbi:MAG: LytTR family DNA-binding domain-containing protein [Lachnospiraceae bacterium]|nr:LytTR family DNA-binding domain-containing protein [Lachnospiraceae bacterium]